MVDDVYFVALVSYDDNSILVQDYIYCHIVYTVRISLKTDFWLNAIRSVMFFDQAMDSSKILDYPFKMRNKDIVYVSITIVHLNAYYQAAALAVVHILQDDSFHFLVSGNGTFSIIDVV